MSASNNRLTGSLPRFPASVMDLDFQYNVLTGQIHNFTENPILTHLRLKRARSQN